ncbi:MAG: MGMT family protein [Syntrophomonas sp.]
MEWYVFETAWGWAAILGNERLISKTILPTPSLEDNFQGIRKNGGIRVNLLTGNDDSFPTVNHFRRYYNGEIISDWEAELDLASFPAFTRHVLEFVYNIPYGKTMTYGEVAKALDNPRAARAVGRAMRINPLPLIIPCHRVVGVNGPGGFSASGGLKTKENMLLWEKSNLSKTG